MAVTPQLVTPVCTVSPAGGGTIAFAPLRDGKVPGLPYGTTTDGEFRAYRYTATPAQGYRFVRFETSVTWTTENHSISTRGEYAGAQVGGDWIYDAEPGDTFDDYFRAFLFAGFPSWIRDEGYGLVEYQAATAITVTAVFAPVRDPTHLLVNSSTAENPARLVYDPTTDLLVADF